MLSSEGLVLHFRNIQRVVCDLMLHSRYDTGLEDLTVWEVFPSQFRQKANLYTHGLIQDGLHRSSQYKR